MYIRWFIDTDTETVSNIIEIESFHELLILSNEVDRYEFAIPTTQEEFTSQINLKEQL
jgi:hypothetical protein